MQTLQRTPLHGRHVELGARLVPFAGWEMPVQYDGVIAEHRAVRTDCGVFDVSHMGELEVEGPRAGELLQGLLSNALDRIGVWPNGSATASGLVLPVLVGPQEPVKVFGNLISERPAAEADAELAVSVHWSLGPLSGTVDESAILRALGVPGMTATIDAPAEIEAGDQRPLSARLWAPANVDLAHVNLQVTAGGGAALASSLSVSGATIGAGSALSLPGAVQGVSVGPGWLQLDATGRLCCLAGSGGGRYAVVRYGGARRDQYWSSRLKPLRASTSDSSCGAPPAL